MKIKKNTFKITYKDIGARYFKSNNWNLKGIYEIIPKNFLKYFNE